MKVLVLTVVTFAGSIAAGLPPQALATGSELPVLQAYVLAGGTVSLPKDGKGHPTLLVIGFSKAASNVTRPWLESCRTTVAAKPADKRATCYDVRMLEDVPRLFRWFVESGMKSGLPSDLQKTVLLIYSDNAAWKKRLGVADDDSAYVVACDKEGRVRATSKGAHNQKDLERLLAAAEG